jgi:hypothetical protein
VLEATAVAIAPLAGLLEAVHSHFAEARAARIAARIDMFGGDG